MLSLKYIRIRQERPLEQRLTSIWRAACTEFSIPCILIYLEADAAYISTNINHLPQPAETEKLLQTLTLLQQQYTGNARGFWKHNDSYFTFDGLPRHAAMEFAAAIFQALTRTPASPGAIQVSGPASCG
ncbi:MAG TPA: hypothetical protein VK927_05815 [Adhaeribacter sp.]|nr:hypothetical protein [Adhaeribacter sp.]